MKRIPKRIKTSIKLNESVIGDSIELMIERLMNNEGIEGVEDRDLVYNDNESGIVNPLTNIRSDKWELMLEEKIGEYEFKHRKIQSKETELKKSEETIEETAA